MTGSDDDRMTGLTVRWSLEGAPGGAVDRLADYVEESSHARFTGRAGLRFKTWRARRGEWFEGCYVFATTEARRAFQEEFEADAAQAPVSQLVGSPPVLVEPCQVVAVAEGWEGFEASARVDGSERA